jgi:hypothetical protein
MSEPRHRSGRVLGDWEAIAVAMPGYTLHTTHYLLQVSLRKSNHRLEADATLAHLLEEDDTEWKKMALNGRR